MSQRLVQLITKSDHNKTLDKIRKRFNLSDTWQHQMSDGRICNQFAIETAQSQALLDVLHPILEHDSSARIVVLPVETILPTPTTPDPNSNPSSKTQELSRKTGISREELLDDIRKNVQLDSTFIWLVILSTIVAAVGLITNNEAVLIGAMVIAPFLGPNIALAFANAIGDASLLWRALRINMIGFGITLAMATGLGIFWPHPLEAPEILSRTYVGLSGVVLALASGAAGVLALVSGVSGVLVGVMVAVALLPPATTLGLMLGAAQWDNALGAGLLLATNVICVNLAANLVFLTKGIRPRKWYEQRKAVITSRLHLAIWLFMLCAVLATIYLSR